MARTERRRAKAAPRREPTPAAAARTRENLPRQAAPAAPKPQQAAPRPQATPRKRNPFGFVSKLMPRAVGDVISELRKVTWPTLSETRYLTVVVAIVAVAVGIFLGLVDLVFGYTIERLFF